MQPVPVTDSPTFLDTGLPLLAGLPYKVRDLSPETVRFGRKEIDLAMVEMPGLMALREEYAGQRPLEGARIMGRLVRHQARGPEGGPGVLPQFLELEH